MLHAASEFDWIHHDLIFSSPEHLWWAKSHAQCPVIDPIPLLCGRYRVYFASRDENGRSRIGSALFCPKSLNVQLEQDLPCLDLGETGSFDDAGVMPACVVNTPKGSKLLFIGWMERKSVPFQNAIGLASINRENGLLTRDYLGPVISTSANEPYFTGTIHVINSGSLFLGYYLSCVGWIEHNGNFEPRYDLKIATSKDLINWQRLPHPALALESQTQGGYASATIVRLSEGYLMFYCMRDAKDYRTDPKHSYKIYTATSTDALNWRKARVPVFSKLPKFAENMSCYPQSLISNNRIFLFYNGNNFGRSGFGCSSIKLAELEYLWQS